MLRGEFVSATYFRTLGLTPIRGRDFALDVDAHAGAATEVIISDALWQRRYNADPSIVGKIVDLDRKPYTIIGVAPLGFSGLTGQAEFFIPITTRSAADLSEAQSHEFFMVARRAPGVTEMQAESAVAVLGNRISKLFPDQFTNNAPWGASAHPLDDGRVAPLIRRSLLVLFGAVGFVLLIACVNVANLLLGRASARRREIAVRLAIGAGRGRLVRLLLTESVLLSLIGAIGSVVVAWFGIHLLSGVNPATLPRTTRRGVGRSHVLGDHARLDGARLHARAGACSSVSSSVWRRRCTRRARRSRRR